MLRTTVTRQARLFATSPPLQRGPLQTGKDALKTVDRAVADTLVKGIETGEKATEAVKKTIGAASGTASEVASDASQEARRVASDADDTARNAGAKIKGKASEVEDKAKEKAYEAQDEAHERTGM